MTALILQFTMSATAYYCFNWCYFMLISTNLSLPKRRGFIAASFFINYALFYLCSMLELSLIVNWAFFFVFLFLETLIYCNRKLPSTLYFSLMGILCGLTINIFCRCIMAIAISQPPSSFDNHINNISNYKWLPVSLGFLLSGVAFHFMSKSPAVKKQQTLISHPQHLSFQLELMGVMFLYLSLNLLLYQSNDNGLLLKLWGIKSCLFTSVGSYLAMRYSLTMCELSDYRDENRAISHQIAGKELEEKNLRTIVYKDPLTGAYNRQCATETIDRLVMQKADFTLCFIDLDGLKTINDVWGHSGGDRYLTSTASELLSICRQDSDMLFRYGGDEFIIVFVGVPISTVKERMKLANSRLKTASAKPDSFPMSISYGIVENDLKHSAEELIQAADEIMYKQKKAKSGHTGGEHQ